MGERRTVCQVEAEVSDDLMLREVIVSTIIGAYFEDRNDHSINQHVVLTAVDYISSLVILRSQTGSVLNATNVLIPPWLQAIYRVFLSRPLYAFQRVYACVSEPCLLSVSADLIKSPCSPEHPISSVATFTRLALITRKVTTAAGIVAWKIVF